MTATTLQPGSVLSYAWGYEQTNVDFFQVTRRTEKTAWIRPIAGILRPHKEEGWSSMSGLKKPIINRFKGPEKRKKIYKLGEDEFLSMDYGVATVCTGPEYTSWYG